MCDNLVSMGQAGFATPRPLPLTLCFTLLYIMFSCSRWFQMCQKHSCVSGRACHHETTLRWRPSLAMQLVSASVFTCTRTSTALAQTVPMLQRKSRSNTLSLQLLRQ